MAPPPMKSLSFGRDSSVHSSDQRNSGGGAVCSGNNNCNGLRWPSNANGGSISGNSLGSNDHGHNQNNLNLRTLLSHSSPADPLSLRLPSFHEGVTLHHHGGDLRGELRLNDIVGNGISGILYKWVNYGKGWRPRWFVLQDGVLSFYKIHGPDRIEVNLETEKGSKVIGEESMRRLSRRRQSASHCRRKPVGEVHLKASQAFD